MKKLLSLLASALLVASASTPVAACSIGKHVDESIDAVLEQQNFNVIANLAKSKESVGAYLSEKAGGEKEAQQSLFFSNGFDGYNKFIDNRSDDLTGSFGASKWTFIDMLNSKFNLGLKLDAKANSSSSTVATQKDLLGHIDWNVDNYEKLNNIKVTNVTASYQENGNPPVTNDSDNAITAFNKIIDLGNMNSTLFDDQKLTQFPDDHSEWNKQLSFLKSSEFTNRTYTKNTTFTYDNGQEIKPTFTFTQIIMLTSVGVINEKPAKSSTDKRTPIDIKVDEYKDAYKNLDAKTKNDLSLDDYMNLMFSNMNIFTAQKQEYSVSVKLDSNSLNNQLDTSNSGINKLINQKINGNNEQKVKNFFVPQLDQIKKDNDSSKKPTNVLADTPSLESTATTKDNQTFTIVTHGFENVEEIPKGQLTIDKLPEGITLASASILNNVMTIDLSAPIKQSNVEQDFAVSYSPDEAHSYNSKLVVSANDANIQSISDDKIWKDFKQWPREGANASYIKGNYLGEIIIPWLQRHSDNAGNIGTNNLNISISNLNGDKLAANSVMTITVNDYNFLKGSYDLNTKSNNLVSLSDAKTFKDSLKLGSAGNGSLSQNDFMYNTFGINDVKLTIDDLLNDWLEDDSSYTASGNLYSIENKPVTATGQALTDILNKMTALANKTVFSSKLNVADDTVTTFNLDLTDSEFKQWNGKTITFKIANKDLLNN